MISSFSSCSRASKATLVGGLCLAGIGVGLALAARRAESKIARDKAVPAVVGKNESGYCTITINGDLSLKATRDGILRVYHDHVMSYQALCGGIESVPAKSNDGAQASDDTKSGQDVVRHPVVQMENTRFPLDIVLRFGGTTSASLRHFKSLTTVLLAHLGPTTCHLKTSVVDGGAGLVTLACDTVIFYDTSTIVIPPTLVLREDGWISSTTISLSASPDATDETSLKTYFASLSLRRKWDVDEQRKTWSGLYRDRNFWTFDTMRSFGINCISCSP
jgi:hypothetical protein